MWSRESTAIELTSPSTQLLGSDGHVESALNDGTAAAGAAAGGCCCADGMRATAPANRMPANTATSGSARDMVN